MEALRYPRSPAAIARMYGLRALDYWQRGMIPPMTATFLAALAKLLSGASVRWIDCQPATTQRVYFANHDEPFLSPGRLGPPCPTSCE